MQPVATARAAPRAPIRILPPELIARIAAGEVVERPASVLKELVENALDAGARRIRVSLEAGGVAELSVHDDGCGLPPHELALAIQPHATSKLRDADNLQCLQTLGFRGEALPSIASVSRFSMVSRQRPASAAISARAGSPGSPASSDAHGVDDSAAWRIDSAGGQPQVPQARPAAGSAGTTVTVSDLFFNLPARQKFLKGYASEAAACADTLQRLALTRPGVAFKLTQGRGTLLELAAVQGSAVDELPHDAWDAAGHPAGSTLSAPELPARAYFQRARELLGRANARDLLELDLHAPFQAGAGASGSPCRLFGLLSPPAVSRPNRNLIYLTVNGRSVKDRTLTSALLEACRHLLPPRRFPIAVLFLELDGADVDINVHPAKTEVRFRQPGRIYALLHQAVRSAFAPRGPLYPQAASFSDADRISSSRPHIPLSFPSTGALLSPAADETQSAPLAPLAPGTPVPESPCHLVTLSPCQEPPSYPEATSPSARSLSVHEAPAPFGKLPETRAPEPFQPAPRSAQPAADFRILGQAAASYIVLEDETGLRVIDQHALHERILFEGLLDAALRQARADSQGLLVPETVELSPAQAALLSAGPCDAPGQPLELLHEMGFDCAPFGPRTLLVRAIPAILKQASPSRVVSEFLESLAAGDEAPPAFWASAESAAASPSKSPGKSPDGKAQRRFSLREKAAYIVSCKAALKAGERLTLEQMHALILEFRRVAGPLAERGNLTCPHGRKLSLDVSWHELERAVGRA